MNRIENEINEMMIIRSSSIENEINKMIELSSMNQELFENGIINDFHRKMNHIFNIDISLRKIIMIRINEMIKISCDREKLSEKIFDDNFDNHFKDHRDLFQFDEINRFQMIYISSELKRFIDLSIEKYLNK